MAQDIDKLNDPKFCSIIQVDKDVSFVLDNRDIEFAVANIPTEKSLGMSRKTYSKKHPLTYDSAILLPANMIGNGNISPKKSILKNSPKCTSTSSISPVKEIRQKRTLDSNSDISQSPVPKKSRKKEISNIQMSPSKFNGRILDKCGSDKISHIRVPSPEIEIIDVIVTNSSTTDKRDSDPFYGKERNKLKISDIQKKRNSKSLPSVLKPCYPSSDDVPITEADIAPNIPSNSVIPDTSVSETNQDALKSRSTNEWLLSTAASVISRQNDETCSAKESDMEFFDKQNLLECEPKVPQGQKTKRELKSLYANLHEISWAKEKEFQQLMSNADHRHSERITAKAVGAGKNLRRLKANSGNNLSLNSNRQRRTLVNKSSAKLALNRAKYGRSKPNVVLKTGLQSKRSLNNTNKRVVKTTLLKPSRQRKINFQNAKVEPKVEVKAKTEIALKTKQIPGPSTRNLKVNRSSKNKIVHSPPNTSKSNIPSALRKVETESEAPPLPKGSTRRFMKKVVEYTKEVSITGKKCGDKLYSTAVKKGSKLRVEVEPLEHTNLWNSSFCEAFSKYVIEQSSSQLESKSKESIKAMFEELMESWFQNQPENPKRKKHEEETLRSSVRQSECAFRYKEIVVKKHENYMQFILVPNAVKQNSLSIEAMKELRDAFVLAKKDCNCRAVLLNSSGTFFCTGIDLSQLVGSNKKQAAEEMAATIKDLVLTISTFTKPVVAAVNGIAVGFGVTLLTLCDVVLASDKATFCIPATRLGYLPEGAITLTLPQVVGSTVATELLLYGRRLTADQALRHGLVSEVLWHSNLMNEVIPRVQIIVSQPLQVMEATKTMVRCQLWDRLKFHMEREWRLLPPLWLDAQCQNNIKKALQTGWLFD